MIKSAAKIPVLQYLIQKFTIVMTMSEYLQCYVQKCETFKEIEFIKV